MNLGIFTKPLMRFRKSFMYLTQKLSISWLKQTFIGLFLLLLLMHSHQIFSQCPWVALQDKMVLLGGDPPNKSIEPIITTSPIAGIKDVLIPVNGSGSGVTWQWSDLNERIMSGLLTDPTSLKTYFKFSDSRFSPDNLDRIYNLEYKLTGTPTNNSCPPFSANIKIKVLPGIHPYNVMTPTSDGFNDVFIIQNITGTEIYPGVIIKIFDRWGQQVFSSKGNKPQFDALAHPYKLPTGTYVYSVKPDEDYPEVVGEITIIR